MSSTIPKNRQAEIKYRTVFFLKGGLEEISLRETLTVGLQLNMEEGLEEGRSALIREGVSSTEVAMIIAALEDTCPRFRVCFPQVGVIHFEMEEAQKKGEIKFTPHLNNYLSVSVVDKESETHSEVLAAQKMEIPLIEWFNDPNTFADALIAAGKALKAVHEKHPKVNFIVDID